MDTLGFCLVIVLGGICIAIGIALSGREDSKKTIRQQKMEERISSMSSFTPTSKIVGVEYFYTFMVDDTHKQICYLDPNSKRIIPYDKIIRVELNKNGNTISSKSTIRTIGGTLIGGALSGGVGAVVGGLSGNSKSINKVSSIQVRITIRDINNPSLTIDAFNARTMTTDGKPIEVDECLCQQAISDANKIVDTIRVIIDETDKKSSNSESLSQSTFSIANELKKLVDLKNEGILTQEEFDNQKAKLLKTESDKI